MKGLLGVRNPVQQAKLVESNIAIIYWQFVPGTSIGSSGIGIMGISNGGVVPGY